MQKKTLISVGVGVAGFALCKYALGLNDLGSVAVGVASGAANQFVFMMDTEPSSNVTLPGRNVSNPSGVIKVPGGILAPITNTTMPYPHKYTFF